MQTQVIVYKFPLPLNLKPEQLSPGIGGGVGVVGSAPFADLPKRRGVGTKAALLTAIV